jgi:hypothetical protein
MILGFTAGRAKFHLRGITMRKNKRMLIGTRIYWLFTFIILGLLITTTACTPVTIDSIKDPEITEHVRRIFVLVKEGNPSQVDYAQNLSSALVRRLAEKRIDASVRVQSPLDLDESKYIQEIKAFSPDAVLIVQATGGTRTRYERQIVDLYWDASLFRRDTRERIWRASIHTPGGSGMSKMLNLTDSILLKLEQDGILSPAGSGQDAGERPASSTGTDQIQQQQIINSDTFFDDIDQKRSHGRL